MHQLEGGNEENALRRLELPPRGMEQVRTMKSFKLMIQVMSRIINKLRLAVCKLLLLNYSVINYS